MDISAGNHKPSSKANEPQTHRQSQLWVERSKKSSQKETSETSTSKHKEIRNNIKLVQCIRSRRQRRFDTRITTKQFSCRNHREGYKVGRRDQEKYSTAFKKSNWL